MNKIALVVSVVSLIVSGLTAVAAWRAPGRVAREASDESAAPVVAALEEKVALLDRQMNAVRVGLATRATPAGGGAAAANDAVAQTLGAVSQRLGELESQTQEARRRGLLPGPLPPAELEKVTATALDRGKSAEERVGALRMLRPVNGRADGRTPEVTGSMVELIQAKDTPSQLRADIIRQLEWIDHPTLKAPLTGVLSSDPDPETRAEAVETLQSFYGDPQVHALVTRIKETDPDPRVRREAERRLADWQRGRRSP